jgi:hypothetical protein
MSAPALRHSFLVLVCGVTIGMLLSSRSSEKTLLASSAAHNGDVSMATGVIDSDVEGVFILDHRTGRLSCIVANLRQAGAIAGQFEHNVFEDLGLKSGTAAKLTMVTGSANFVRGGSTASVAGCVVYVADADSNQFAAYSFMWNQTLSRGGTPQGGSLVLLFKGRVRDYRVQ